MVAAALDKEPVARPAPAELLAQLTSAPTRPDRGAVLDTQTVLLRTWRPVGVSGEIPVRPAAAAEHKGRSRRTPGRALLRPVALSIAVLAGAGVAVAFTLSGHPAADPTRPPPRCRPPRCPRTTAGPPPRRIPRHPGPARALAHPRAARPVPRRPGRHCRRCLHRAPASAAGPSAPGLPVLVAGGYSGRDPGQLTFAADGSNTVTAITWSSWTATGATGSGRAGLALCLPGCVGTPASVVPSTITLSDPVNGHVTQLTESRGGSAQSWNYPGNWPQSAS